MSVAFSIKNRIRRALAQPQVFRWMFKDTVSIVVYHDVSDQTSAFCNEHALNVTPAQFTEQMKFLQDHFHIIGPDELMSGNFSTPAVMVTFDDGMAGYFHRAVPIMEKLKIPSLLFLNMGAIQGKLFWSGLVTYLTAYDPQFAKYIEAKNGGHIKLPAFLLCGPKTVADYIEKYGSPDLEARVRTFYGEFGTTRDLQEAAQNPFVFYGNHLYNHYNAARLSDDELKEEYRENQEWINQYSCGRRLFAYPYGQPGSCFTPQNTKVLLESGANAIFFSGGGTNLINTEKKLFDRVGVDPAVKTINDLITRLQAGSLRAGLRKLKP